MNIYGRNIMLEIRNKNFEIKLAAFSAFIELETPSTEEINTFLERASTALNITEPCEMSFAHASALFDKRFKMSQAEEIVLSAFEHVHDEYFLFADDDCPPTKWFAMPTSAAFDMAAMELNISVPTFPEILDIFWVCSEMSCTENGSIFTYNDLEQFLEDADWEADNEEEAREEMNAPYVLFAEASRT